MAIVMKKKVENNHLSSCHLDIKIVNILEYIFPNIYIELYSIYSPEFFGGVCYCSLFVFYFLCIARQSHSIYNNPLH